VANAVYPKAKQAMLGGDVALDTDDVRVMLVKSTYTYDGADEFVADLGAVDNGRSAALGSKTLTDGAFDAADTTLTATAAEACSALVVFIHTGSDATARLLAYIDTPTSGLPFTPAAGQAVPITFNAFGIFAL
jgi:hypothetical protein